MYPLKHQEESFIRVKDIIDRTYPSLNLGIKSDRLAMESEILHSFICIDIGS